MRRSTSLTQLESSLESRSVQDMALRLWESGDYDEARRLLKSALFASEGWQPEEVLRARKDLMIFEMEGGDFGAALEVGKLALPLIDRCNDDGLIGKLYNELGAAYSNLGESDLASEMWTASSVYHGRNGDGQSQAEVENNLSINCIRQKDSSGAREHLVNALGSCRRPISTSFEAQIKDTEVQLFLLEGKIRAAVDVAIEANWLARKSESEPILKQTLSTTCEVMKRWEHEEEGERLRRLLKEKHWSVYAAAKKMGISKQGLAKMLKTRFPEIEEERKGNT